MSDLLKPFDGATARLMTPEEKADYNNNRHIAVTQSGLKKFMKDPMAYYRQYVKEPREPSNIDSPSTEFGKDVEHFLYNNSLRSNVVAIPQNVLNDSGQKRNKAGQTQYTDWLAENNYSEETHTLLKQNEFAKLLSPLAAVKKNVMEHPRARKLIYEGLVERSVGIFGKCRFTGIGTQGELDSIHSGGFLFDIKTTKETRITGFANEIWNFGYHVQAWWYRDLVEQLTGVRYPFIFIAIGNNGGHYVETYDLDDFWFTEAEKLIKRGMTRLYDAYEKNRWQTATHGKIHTVKMKPWMKSKVWENET